ncbi:helix-turn-helix domain-containing protein [Verrucomicrobiaceae bacterium 5K15]|uniref:Helix-turn-helix domain-containing protein n=1 Tax=Oceaniferula flava TaxID=2800421 RepID=A0AAE2V8Z5_9BACT|nr:helix-turn-helix domain-containing protein [Oceaniferula flavus]MBK1856257.1 helix-turn-helix domain-containing protein [Oceaniferula flavus]MBM1137564.1 helix-turn-helix domain-containing protein [Oceaniferula flavus]
MADKPCYNIAVIFPDWYSFLLNLMDRLLEIRGIREHCHFRNFIHTDFNEPVEFPQGYQPDAILCSFDNDQFDAPWLKELALPVVNIFACLRSDHAQVLVRQESTATLICEHFSALGYEEIGMLDTEHPLDYHPVQDCLRAECERRHIPFWSMTLPEGIRAGSFQEFEREVPELREKLLGLEKRTGVYTSHDMRGRLFADFCTAYDVRVPEQVGILGRFDSINARLCTPELSSIVMPTQEIAEKAIQLLVRLVEGSHEGSSRVEVDASEIRVRESTVGESNPDMVVLKARAMIRDNACRGLTVDELTQSLPLARSTFEKRYRALLGSSPAQDIRQLRAEKARRLLLTTSRTLEQIASAVGFNDARPFVVFFKREAGMTPGEFRKKYES